VSRDQRRNGWTVAGEQSACFAVVAAGCRRLAGFGARFCCPSSRPRSSGPRRCSSWPVPVRRTERTRVALEVSALMMPTSMSWPRAIPRSRRFSGVRSSSARRWISPSPPEHPPTGSDRSQAGPVTNGRVSPAGARRSDGAGWLLRRPGRPRSASVPPHLSDLGNLLRPPPGDVTLCPRLDVDHTHPHGTTNARIYRPAGPRGCASPRRSPARCSRWPSSGGAARTQHSAGR
jgi:hypothetical protein